MENFFFHSNFNFLNRSRIKTPVNDAIVFVIGGGNYIEYQNLIDNARGCYKKNFGPYPWGGGGVFWTKNKKHITENSN